MVAALITIVIAISMCVVAICAMRNGRGFMVSAKIKGLINLKVQVTSPNRAQASTGDGNADAGSLDGKNAPRQATAFTRVPSPPKVSRPTPARKN
jgi:hypothetical protein